MENYIVKIKKGILNRVNTAQLPNCVILGGEMPNLQT